ncbi:MAG: hypothetical protein R3E04_05425 [Sphingobium sp.]
MDGTEAQPIGSPDDLYQYDDAGPWFRSMFDAFASARESAYIVVMAIFPRPVSPRSAAGDLWSYLTEHRSHKWPLLGVSIALTWIIVWAFLVDANTNTMPRQNKITYFQSWNGDRADSAIILQQMRDLERREEALRKKQKEMQKLADTFGIEWRKDAERNDKRRAEALTYIRAMLEKRLADARAKEAAGVQVIATE